MIPFAAALLLGGIAGSGGGGGGGFTTLNPNDKGSALAISGGNLIASTSSAGADGSWVSAVHGKATGKWMFEVTVTTAGSGEVGIGLHGAGGEPTTYPGYNARSIGYITASGVFYNNSAIRDGSATFTAPATTVLTCYIDCDNNRIWFARNGTIAQTGGTPAAGTGGSALTLDKAIYPMLWIPNSGWTLTANFGATSFAYPVSGFSGWTDVAPGAALDTFRAMRMVPRTIGFYAHSVAEMELLTSAGGTSILTGGTPTISGAIIGGTVAGAYDNVTTTYCAQGVGGLMNQPNQWFGYAFGSNAARNVTHVAIRGRDGGAGAEKQSPTLINLYASNDNVVFWKARTNIPFAAWGANTPGDRQVVAL